MKYVAWTEMCYIIDKTPKGVLAALIECIQYGTGGDLVPMIEKEKIYEDEQYVVTADSDGYCFLFEKGENKMEVRRDNLGRVVYMLDGDFEMSREFSKEYKGGLYPIHIQEIYGGVLVYERYKDFVLTIKDGARKEEDVYNRPVELPGKMVTNGDLVIFKNAVRDGDNKVFPGETGIVKAVVGDLILVESEIFHFNVSCYSADVVKAVRK